VRFPQTPGNPHLTFSPIVPARLSFRDGALHSEQFGDVYFSTDGGIEETRHVFLAGNGLPARFATRPHFTIVELGFGTGLNFLTTWQAWRGHAAASARLHYVAVEKHPLLPEDLARVQRHWPQFSALARALQAEYPPLFPGFHRLLFDGGRIMLTLLLGEVQSLLDELEATADAFFLDGFSPSRNPQMWTPGVFAALRRLAVPGTTAATYSVAGTVRAGLTQAGFAVERQPGFGHKREMLVARVPGLEPVSAPVQRVVVIGGGIAGASCALALARRGVRAEVLEAQQ